MLRYKYDVYSLLLARYSTYQILKQNILPQGTVQKLREGKMVSAKSLDKLCKLLYVQPGEIIEYVKDE